MNASPTSGPDRGGERWTPPTQDEFEQLLHEHATEVGRLKAEVKRLSRHDEWREIAQGMTPGGSEYCDPAYVREYLLTYRQRFHDAQCRAVKAERAQRAALPTLSQENEDG